MVVRKIGQEAKRLLLAAGLALLLPGTAGAAGFGPAERSFWEWASPAAFLDRVWEGVTELWTGGSSVDPNGGGMNGAVGDGGSSVDPNG